MTVAHEKAEYWAERPWLEVPGMCAGWSNELTRNRVFAEILACDDPHDVKLPRPGGAMPSSADRHIGRTPYRSTALPPYRPAGGCRMSRGIAAISTQLTSRHAPSA